MAASPRPCWASSLPSDQLNNISFAVRQAGSRFRLQKADARLDPGEHSTLEAFLTSLDSGRDSGSGQLDLTSERDDLNAIQRALD